MLDRIPERLNAIYESLDRMNTAEALGDSPMAQRSLAKGLAESCVLFTDAVEDVSLANISVDPGAVSAFRELSRLGELERFLDLERRFLAHTNTSPAAIDELMDQLRVVAQSPNASFAQWRGALERLRKKVCVEAKHAGRSVRRDPVLKAAFLGTGGIMVILTNNQLGFSGGPVDPQVAALSTVLGVGAINQAWRALGSRSARE